MKREKFQIKLNDEVVGVNFKWNAALRSMQKIAQENANRIDGSFARTASAWTQEGIYHVSGTFVWTGSNGETLNFSIDKL